MGLALRSNQATFDKDLDRIADAMSVAKPRILNKLRDQAETAGLRKVADIYQVSAKIMEKYATIRVAGRQDLEASISIKGQGFPLIMFNAARTSKGVAVTIKGRRIEVDHAFITRMPDGHVGVFARGAYGGKGGATLHPSGQVFGRFAYGRDRLPINELFTFAPPDAFANAEVVDTMNDRMDEQGPKVAEQELRFAQRSQ